MIACLLDDKHFIYILPSPSSPASENPLVSYESEKEYLEHYGKWLVYGKKETIEKLSIDLDPLVESGVIDQAKYSNKHPSVDLLPERKRHVMCVYSDDRDSLRVMNVLRTVGVTYAKWKYDRETIEDWSDDGKLRTESRKSDREPPKNYR